MYVSLYIDTLMFNFVQRQRNEKMILLCAGDT